jgi:hypothetical protein
MFLASFLALPCLLVLSDAHVIYKPVKEVVEHRDAQAAVSSDQLLALFRKLNSETSEVFASIASYLKDMASQNPTEESIQRYQAATALLKSLQRSKKVYDEADPQDVVIMDEDTGEVIHAKSWGSFLKGAGSFAKGVIQGATSDESDEDQVQNPEGATLSDTVMARAKTDLKIASTLAKDGPFADVLADPEARISAEGVGKIVGTVGKGLFGLLG